jgi:bleomycin hydrolase
MKWLSLAVCLFLVLPAFAQPERKDRGVFLEPKNEFYDTLKAGAEQFRKRNDAPKKKEFRLDFSGVAGPASPSEFTAAWHNPPVSQGLSGMCWCFSATSFFESEVKRLTGREVRLSELHTVYWEYVEKAREYVRTRGESVFGQGSEGNAVPRIWKKYGAVPAEAYDGMLQGQRFHDHDGMFAMMESHLKSVKAANAWDEAAVVGVVTSIMNSAMGEPPAKVTAGGKSMTPKEYFASLRLNPDDYVDVMSLMEKPYNQFVQLEVPDNWWHSAEYYNVPLETFTAIIRAAVRSGKTLAIGGDVSEPGYEGHAGMGVVPAFDIPSAAIDESARQFRFSNGTTTDDHGVHMVGWTEKNGVDWYLIKDSAAGSRNNSHPGYYFYHPDYVKLKMLSFVVHKDAVKEVLPGFGNK